VRFWWEIDSFELIFGGKSMVLTREWCKKLRFWAWGWSFLRALRKKNKQTN
jgi:hypothetical protein